MQICFYEDEYHANFYPLTLTRPVDDLRIGLYTIAVKWSRALNNPSWSRAARQPLQQVFSHAEPDPSSPALWINSRYLPSDALLADVRGLSTGTCIRDGETIVAAAADAETSRSWLKRGIPDVSAMLVMEGRQFQSIENLWDLYRMNGREIRSDLRLAETPSAPGQATVSDHAILENNEQIYLGKGCKIEAGAILMAEDGPVYIGDNATVMAGSIIRGPAAICEGATVKMDAKIYPDTTIGPVCKVGGEINNSIFHSYSNKGHDGFVGNSVIGQWCNLGADTNTSNLKNNYSTVRITDWESREEVETGQQFLGTIMGDHTKTAINTQLNTGTVCGVSCNIFAGDFPPKFIPSFSWVGSNVIQPYRIDKALQAMEAMMARRDVELTESYQTLMQSLFKAEHR